jgi:hypothetical protein
MHVCLLIYVCIVEKLIFGCECTDEDADILLKGEHWVYQSSCAWYRLMNTFMGINYTPAIVAYTCTSPVRIIRPSLLAAVNRCLPSWCCHLASGSIRLLWRWASCGRCIYGKALFKKCYSDRTAVWELRDHKARTYSVLANMATTAFKASDCLEDTFSRFLGECL